MKKKVLIIVDMQEDFVSGSLGTKEARAIVPRVAEKAAHFDGTVILPLIPMGMIISKRRKAGSFLCRIASKEPRAIALCRNWRAWRSSLLRKKWKRRLLAPLLLLKGLENCGIPSRVLSLWVFARISALFPMPLSSRRPCLKCPSLLTAAAALGSPLIPMRRPWRRCGVHK